MHVLFSKKADMYHFVVFAARPSDEYILVTINVKFPKHCNLNSFLSKRQCHTQIGLCLNNISMTLNVIKMSDHVINNIEIC